MSPKQYDHLIKNKQDSLFGAIEEIEGRVLTNGEIKEFCFLEQKEGRPCEELVYWRLKPILHFKWKPSTGELRTLKLYSIPTDEKKDENPPLGN